MMVKIYVITEIDIDGKVWVVKAFENADDATRFCMEHNRNTCHCFCMEETELEKYFSKTLDNTPTIDAVPVVRCKDCKYFDHSDFGKGEEYWCKHLVSTDDYTHCHKVTEDDFCAWGERKDNV